MDDASRTIVVFRESRKRIKGQSEHFFLLLFLSFIFLTLGKYDIRILVHPNYERLGSRVVGIKKRSRATIRVQVKLLPFSPTRSSL